MKKNDTKGCYELLRYLPAVSFILMLIHVILLNFGIDLFLSELLVVFGGFYLAHVFSRVFHFCFIHRLMIHYTMAVMCCIWLRRFPNGINGIFGENIGLARFIMMVIGLSIFVAIIIDRNKKRKGCKN